LWLNHPAYRKISPTIDLLILTMFKNGHNELKYRLNWTAETNVSDMATYMDRQSVLAVLELTEPYEDFSELTEDWVKVTLEASSSSDKSGSLSFFVIFMVSEILGLFQQV
jgi:hypothetical protein